MKRIASHATSVETLKNGAKLYHLPNGREVEQVAGKTPYVVKAGTVAPATKPAPAPTVPATTAPAASAPTAPAATSTGGQSDTSSSQTQTPSSTG